MLQSFLNKCKKFNSETISTMKEIDFGKAFEAFMNNIQSFHDEIS